MAAPPATGCFKCGRPGHWSRDCPSASASADPTANPNPSRFASSSSYPTAKPRPPASAAAAPPPSEGDNNRSNKKKKKERTTRPKLTPDLLLSDDGIGFVLRYFPKAFKPRARPGHERCISDLRDRVARGGDPTVLHEAPSEEVTPAGEPDGTAAEDAFLGTEDNSAIDPVHEDLIDPPMESNDVDLMQDLLNETYEKAADEAQIPGGEGSNREAPEPSAAKETSLEQQEEAGGSTKRAKIELTEEQRARMEANRLKALERAAAARARASQSQPT